MKKLSTNKIVATRCLWRYVVGRPPVLKRYGLLLFFTLLFSELYAQVNISGIVKDRKGATVPGVSVKLKGTTVGTLTDVNGHYSLKAGSNNGVLIFTYIGYGRIEVSFSNTTEVNATLTEEQSNLQEVVVTGYGSQSRTTLTTAISKLDKRVLDNIPYQNVATAMQGTLAGVRVQATGGQPGIAPRVIVRGGTSINNPNGAAPLYIVDGVIRDLNDISADDIESLQVLKDAAATAIYGARGSNGVVLVTTKSGKPGTTTVTYKYDLGASKTVNTYDFPSAQEYIQTARLGILHAAEFVPARLTLLTTPGSWGTGNDLTKNTLWTTQYLTPANQYKLNEGWQSMPDPVDPTKTIIFKDTDFQPLLYQTGLSNNHYVSVSGGTEKATFNVGVGYMAANGTIKTSDYKRTTFNLNGNIKATDNLSVQGRVSYQRSGSNAVGALGYNALMRATALPHVAKYNFEDGTIAQGFSSSLGNPDYYLPLFEDKRIDEQVDKRLSLSLGAHWKIVPGLTFDPQLSYFNGATNNNLYFPAFLNGLTLNSTRSASGSYSSNDQYQADALFNYKKQFHNDHNFSALAGFSYLNVRGYGLSASGRGAATDNIPTLNASSIPVGVSSNFSRRLILSYLSSINYDYKQKYLVTFNGRYDGASNLGQGHKWGFFPGVSVGWNIHEENFWKALPQNLLRMKLRASYGVNGNITGLGDYTAQGTYASNAVYNGASAIQNTVLPNSDLEWEQSKTLDLGTDIGLFNSRVNFIFDVYRRVTDNLITTLTLPTSTGFATILTNYGSYKNKGIEIEVNASILSPASPFKWQVSFNAAKVKSTILKLPYSGTDKNRVGGEFLWDAKAGTYTWQGGLQEGGRVGDMFAYKQLGIYATDADAAKAPIDAINNFPKRGGDVIWQDTDGNGTIDARDRIYVGNMYPDLTGGFSNYFSYKSLGLTVRMDYTTGHTIANALAQTFDQNGAGDINMTRNMVDNGWKKQGDIASMPQYLWLDPKSNLGRGNSIYWVSGDYLALREVTLSYNIPVKIMKKMKLNSLRLNLTGNNLHYFTKFLDGVNVEDGGQDNGRYPLAQSYIFGASLTF